MLETFRKWNNQTIKNKEVQERKRTYYEMEKSITGYNNGSC